MLERMMDTMNQIKKLLQSNRTANAKWKTHVSMVCPKGAFTLGRLNTENFMDFFSRNNLVLFIDNFIMENK